MNRPVLFGEHTPPQEVVENIDAFLREFNPYEVHIKNSLVLYYDKRSASYYTLCHLSGCEIVKSCDLEAALDGDEDEIYKLNRDVTEDQSAYKQMEEDAYHGRTFEDIVLEFDQGYHNDKPLKVYGGQHRVKAIGKALDENGSIIHGVRLYFHLTRDQKVEIATVNNTSIAVPNDLLDRMREQLLGSELRDWCQSVGLLEEGKDFSDSRSPVLPTVRVARTLLVNYFAGIEATDNDLLQPHDLHQPTVCRSGGEDNTYITVRKKVEWNDLNLIEMGKEFARLHSTQQERVKNRKFDTSAEFARKALSLAIVASWAYAAGLFQRNSTH